MLDSLRLRISVAPWRIPAPLWFLVASPLLWWAFGCQGRVFHWPRGVSYSPLSRSFWNSTPPRVPANDNPYGIEV